MINQITNTFFQIMDCLLISLTYLKVVSMEIKKLHIVFVS